MVIHTDMIQTSVRDIVQVVFRHKWKILLFMAAVMIADIAYTYLVAELYRSDAKLLIRVGRENVQVDPSVSGPMMPVMQDRESEVNSELAILSSPYIIERAVDTLGIDRILMRPDEGHSADKAQEDVRIVRRLMRMAKYTVEETLIRLDLIPRLTDREKALKKIIKGMSVAAEKRTNIITVSYQAPGAELAQAVVNTLVQLYLERHIAVFSAQASPEFFEDQERKFKDDLTVAEQALGDFRAKFGIVNLDDQRAEILKQISQLETARGQAATTSSATQAEVKSLEETLAGRAKTLELSRTSGRPNQAADVLKEQLHSLRLKETDLAARYNSTHPPLVDLREQIKQTEAALAKEEETRTEVTTGVDTNYQTLQLNLETKRAEAKAQQASLVVLDDELKKAHERLQEMGGIETDLARLMRDVDMKETEYKQYRDNLQRARINAELDKDKVSNVSVVQPASLPIMPFKPNKTMNLILGVIFGTFGGLFLAFAIEFLDDTLSTSSKAEKRLGVPVLTVISEAEFKSSM